MISKGYKIAFLFCLVLTNFLCVNRVYSQDLEPRYLSDVPIGLNIMLATYGYSTGNILLDNSLPVEDLNAKLNTIGLAYVRSFKMLNKLAKFDAIVPYSFANFSGVVNSIDSSTTRNGFGDPLIRLSMIFIGAQPLGVSEFMQREDKKFKLGALLRLRLPLGHYDPTKLINLGANRWAVKVGVAGSYTIRKKLILEAHLTSWFFTENNEFFNGNSLKQKPLLGAQLHITYVFKPGVWAAVSFGNIGLGETILNDVEQDNLQNTSRAGAAFAYRLNKSQALKFAFTSGVTTRYGANFTTLLLAYQYMWFGK